MRTKTQTGDKTMTKAIERIIEDAKKAGYRITRNGTQVTIGRYHRGNGRCLLGITICEDGTAYRTDIDLTIATTIRTQKQMRQILGI